MHIQPKFNETRPEILHGLVREHPLGCIVTLGEHGLEANHLPFHLDTSLPPHGILRAHFPKANHALRGLHEDTEALVIFQGPQAYVTPSWYPGKHEHGQVVPTWNYAVVHAYGSPRFIDDKAWLLDHVTRLTDTHESAYKEPWRVSDAPTEYIDNLVAHITGIEIVVKRMLGKWKVSQNRPAADRVAVAAGLNSDASTQAAAVAALVGKYHAETSRG